MGMMEMALLPWAQRVRRKANLPVRLSWGDAGAHSLSLGDFDEPRVQIHVRDDEALRLLLDPTLETLGQAYVEGLIDVEGQLEDILAMAHGLTDAGADDSPGLMGRLRRRVAHTRELDSDAIRYHYDVSNAFYAEWLDSAMVYSCAYFENGDEDLATAQQKKIDHILTKVQLQPGQRLLDIGCGWGALVIRAAQKFGARCVGVTLSENQYALARERVREAGLEGQVEIRLQDYRDVNDGPFDRITSVGMFEHVGLNHLADYFAHIRALLAPDGWVLNHGITSTDADDGEATKGAGRFIDRYVFPHGELPHIGTVLRTMQQGGLEVFDAENLRRHYAHTLAHWSRNFEARRERVRALVDEKRWRIWRVYLAGCAWAFEHDEVALFQVLCRPARQGAGGLPWSRRWMYGPG
ncbi:MAG: cyclopropane-fatty-acyl-phospholipid synthase family protein [Hydrogenophaga sp.]|nr:cyclopropane-fatty-acyl-phospholipid synthase family protein [Hydrogenophaga sp.]